MWLANAAGKHMLHLVPQCLHGLYTNTIKSYVCGVGRSWCICHLMVSYSGIHKRSRWMCGTTVTLHNTAHRSHACKAACNPIAGHRKSSNNVGNGSTTMPHSAAAHDCLYYYDHHIALSMSMFLPQDAVSCTCAGQPPVIFLH